MHARVPFRSRLVRIARQCFLVVALLSVAPGAWAQTSTWNATSGDWNAAGNWSPSGVPGSGTTVQIGTTSSNRTANITSANAVSQGADIGVYAGNIGTVNILNGRTWTNNAYALVVGTYGTGTLNIQSGGKLINNSWGTIASNSGSVGSVTVTGAGSQWTNSAEIYVGHLGSTGTLTVSDGGKVTSPYMVLANAGSGNGTLNLNGTAGSRGVVETSRVQEGFGTGTGAINFNGGILRATATQSNFLQNFETGDVKILAGGAFIDSNGFNIGISTSLRGTAGGSLSKQGTGTLTLTGASVNNADTRIEGGTLEISSGGSVSDTFTYIGMNTGDVGTLTVTGSGSQSINSVDLYVGRSGRGTLNVLNGAKVSNSNATIGRFSTAAGSVATVNGAGSEWTNSLDLFVGEEGIGTLNIEAGGKVSNVTGYIGYASGTSGTATVTGSGSQWNNSHVLSVGELGSGTLNVLAGGKVTAAYTAIGYHGTGTGIGLVSGANSEWATTNWLDVGSYSTGTLTVQSGGKMTNGAIGTIGYASASTGAATVTGANSLWASTGNLEIGHSGTGTLTVSAAGKVTAPATLLAVVDSSKGTLNLNGTAGSRGVLETAYISEGTGTQGGFINFNGGILRATGNQTDFLRNLEPGDVMIISGAFIDTQNFNVGISTMLQGPGFLTKQGAGTLTLSGPQLYGGATSVEAGTLLISGSIGGSAATVTNADSTLGGTGTVGAVSVGSGAILQGGDGTTASGTLTSGGTVSLNDGSVIKLTLGTGLTHSSLARTGGLWSFDTDQAFAFNVVHGATNGFYDNLITGLSGSEAGLGTIGSWLIVAGGVTGTFSYDGAGGVDLTVSAIPEPGSAALLGLGGLLFANRRRARLHPFHAYRSHDGLLT